jgi:hypothetical protein
MDVSEDDHDDEHGHSHGHGHGHGHGHSAGDGKSAAQESKSGSASGTASGAEAEAPARNIVIADVRCRTCGVHLGDAQVVKEKRTSVCACVRCECASPVCVSVLQRTSVSAR